MSELLWIFPIVFAISLVLGGCRAETAPRILAEAGKTFGRIVVAMVIVVLLLQGVLWALPRLF